MNELSEMINIGGGHFGTIFKARWKKTNDFVACKTLKNIESIHYKQIKAFLHELNMHKKVDFCTRIIRILGISYGKLICFYFLLNAASFIINIYFI
jgi:serine/threonine protein kinase